MSLNAVGEQGMLSGGCPKELCLCLQPLHTFAPPAHCRAAISAQRGIYCTKGCSVGALSDTFPLFLSPNHKSVQLVFQGDQTTARTQGDSRGGRTCHHRLHCTKTFKPALCPDEAENCFLIRLQVDSQAICSFHKACRDFPCSAAGLRSPARRKCEQV